MTLVSVAATAPAYTTQIKLSDGRTLSLNETTGTTRNITAIYLSQAMESIPKLFPNSKIVLSKEGLVGDPSISYSVIAYEVSPASSTVKIQGMVESAGRAWYY